MAKFIPFLLIVLISSTIIFSWFHEGKIISNTSEEDLNIYHSQKTAEDYSHFWYPPGIGEKGPFQFARFPAFFVLGQLEKMGMPVFLRQALLIWVLMTTGIISMYLLIKGVFKIPSSFALIGGLFYLLNIYSVTQVWKRFLYHGIFAWAYLPLFLLLWIQWIESKKKRWLFLFLLTSALSSYAFSQPTFIITLWTPCGIYVLVKLWQSRAKIKEAIDIFLKSLIGIILWSVVNIWWLYPMLILGSTWSEIVKATRGEDWLYSFHSLQAVSQHFPLWEIILLRQSWYLSATNDFGGLYLNPVMILINILPLFFVVLAIFKYRQYPYKGFLLTLAFVGLFISKGTNFPFGYTFFYLLFSHSSFATAFRNSYEKFGLVWMFAYTILFTFGFLYFLKSKKSYLSRGTLLFLILGILVIPIWSGSLFPKTHKVTVPQYYNKANNYLNQHFENRLFHIPFHLTLENSIYSWGYTGGDPAHSLFNLESITPPQMPLYSDIAKLLPDYLKYKNFPKILGTLGVGNVILHKDIMYPKIDIEETTKNIENWEGVTSKKEFGQLSIYSLSNELIKPEIYAATYVAPVGSLEEGLAELTSPKTETKSPVFIDSKIWKDINIQIRDIPKLNFKRISGDRYLVEVQGAPGSFILILNNTFDKSWQAKINNQIIDKHFIVNGFANGWLVEKTGDYKIDIRLKVWPWD